MLAVFSNHLAVFGYPVSTLWFAAKDFKIICFQSFDYEHT
jgi:hypothetical protein